MRGKIVKGIAGFYYVWCEDDKSILNLDMFSFILVFIRYKFVCKDND